MNKEKARRALRCAALALALAGMAGQALTSLHFALVAHVTCSEHGELIETGAPAAQLEAPDGRSTIAAAAGEEHGHDHCAVALLRRQQARSSAAPAAPLGFAPPLHQSPLAQTIPPALAIDLLSVAPKNSPPV